jgi:glycosyltransferase involved in cell wall biosynthesis
VGGGRSATLNLLEALFARDRHNEYTVVLTQHEQIRNAGTNVRQLVSGKLSAIGSRLWAQAVLPVYLRAWQADLVHHVKNLTIVGAPCPVVVTVHDTTTLRHPDMWPGWEVWYWRHVEPRALRAAAAVVTISHEMARDLSDVYGMPLDAIHVIHDAYSPIFSPTAGDPDDVRARYGITGPFVLHVGSISRKKNLTTLVRAFARLRDAGVVNQLVLVGRVYQKGRDLELEDLLRTEEQSRGVVLTGPVPYADLPGFYRAAAAVAVPSLHEGFGIPPVEAMACGTPVVVSRGGALPEVVDDAAWLLDNALDPDELADALRSVIGDIGRRSELVEKGFRRASAFTAERAAERTLALYREVTARSRRTHG